MNACVAIFGFSREPAMYVSLVNAAIIVAVSLGAPISPEAKAAIDGLLVAVAGVVIRSQVSPAVSTPAAPPAVVVTPTPHTESVFPNA